MLSVFGIFFLGILVGIEFKEYLNNLGSGFDDLDICGIGVGDLWLRLGVLRGW